MKCPRCGAAVSVHISPNVASGFTQAYCPGCRCFIAKDNAFCRGCRQDLYAFVTSGFARCPSCYELAGVRAHVPAGVYPAWRDAASREIDSLAVARTQELLEWVLSSNAPPGVRGDVGQLDYRGTTFRVRLARNIRGLPFPQGQSGEALSRLEAFVVGPTSALHGVLSAMDVPADQSRAYCGDEDHLRVEWLYRAQPSRAQLACLGTTIHAIDGLFDYAKQPESGYFTACPRNAGGGIKLSTRLPRALGDGAVRRKARRAGMEIARTGDNLLATRRLAHPSHLEAGQISLATLLGAN